MSNHVLVEKERKSFLMFKRGTFLQPELKPAAQST